jgi:hypothetical protein
MKANGQWAIEKEHSTAQIRAIGDGQYDGFVLLKEGNSNFAVIK